MELLVAPVEHITFDIEVLFFTAKGHSINCQFLFICCARWPSYPDPLLLILFWSSFYRHQWFEHCFLPWSGSTRWPNLTSNHQVALSQQLGAQPLPFPGMDKSGAAVCEFYVRIHLQPVFWNFISTTRWEPAARGAHPVPTGTSEGTKLLSAR